MRAFLQTLQVSSGHSTKSWLAIVILMFLGQVGSGRLDGAHDGMFGGFEQGWELRTWSFWQLARIFHSNTSGFKLPFHQKLNYHRILMFLGFNWLGRLDGVHESMFGGFGQEWEWRTWSVCQRVLVFPSNTSGSQRPFHQNLTCHFFLHVSRLGWVKLIGMVQMEIACG